jgi:hypothetical protein
VTQVGDIIFTGGRPQRVVEAEMIYRDEKPFYVALRCEPAESEDPADPGARA